MRTGLKTILLCIGILLAASVTQAGTDAAKAAGASDTVSLWVMDNGLGSQRALARLIRKFQRETSIPVQVRFLNWGEAFGEITAALDSGRGPDVLQLGSTWVPYFAVSGKIAPLVPLLNKIDSTRFFKESFKSSHVALDSNVYSFPWFVDVRALYVNENMWKDLALKEGEVDTYVEFVGALRALSRMQRDSATKVAPFALPGNGDWTGPQHMAPFIWSYGGDFLVLDSSGYRSALLDSTTLAGLNYFLKIFGDRELSPYGLNENSVESTNRFIRSEQLFMYGTSEIIKQMEISNEEGGLKESPITADGIAIVNPLEGPAGKVGFVGGSHLTLSPNHKAAGEALLQFLLRADNMDAYTRQVGFLPADESIVNIWRKDSRYSQLIETMKTGKSFPNIPEWVAVEETLIELSNSLGALYRDVPPSPSRNRQVAELLWNAHQRIELAVGHRSTLEKGKTLPYIERVLFSVTEEKIPETLEQFVAEVSENPMWRVTALIAVIIAVCLMLLVLKYYWKT